MGPVHNITQLTYYTTIQAALEAAKSGDTIEVGDGTYDESITFPVGKVITLRSLHGPSYTTITGVNGSATVTCSNSPDGTTLEGFMITHNSVDTGSGIVIYAGYLTINNCTISYNYADYGGGIENDSGTLTITGSTISYNSAYSGGGGIYLLYSDTNDTIIGGSNVSDLDNFNSFTNNYETGDYPSAGQHICCDDGSGGSVDCHLDYPNNYFIPD